MGAVPVDEMVVTWGLPQAAWMDTIEVVLTASAKVLWTAELLGSLAGRKKADHSVLPWADSMAANSAVLWVVEMVETSVAWMVALQAGVTVAMTVGMTVALKVVMEGVPKVVWMAV